MWDQNTCSVQIFSSSDECENTNLIFFLLLFFYFLSPTKKNSPSRTRRKKKRSNNKWRRAKKCLSTAAAGTLVCDEKVTPYRRERIDEASAVLDALQPYIDQLP